MTVADAETRPAVLPLSIVADEAGGSLGWSIRRGDKEIARFAEEAAALACLDILGSTPAPGIITDPPGGDWKLIESRGFFRSNGPSWTRTEGEARVYGFRALPKHLNRQGIVHGGMLMAFLDRTLGMEISAATGAPIQATIQLDTQFVSVVNAGDFVESRAKVVRRTRSVIFVWGELSVDGRPVARAQGIWKVREPR